MFTCDVLSPLLSFVSRLPHLHMRLLSPAARGRHGDDVRSCV